MLGQLHFQGGRGVEKDDDKALEYFKRAVENDNSHAQAYMAKIYAEGSERIEKDLDKAFELFQASAKQVCASVFIVLCLFIVGCNRCWTKHWSFVYLL